MVSIKEAISSGSWLHCEYEYDERIIKFRLKILSFRKVNLKEIDNPEEIDTLESDATLMIMEAELINLVKEPLDCHYVHNLILTDQDDFNFSVFGNSHITFYSDFAKKTRLNRFHHFEPFMPKIKTKGSLIFQLPNDGDAEYFIALKDNGIVQEV